MICGDSWRNRAACAGAPTSLFYPDHRVKDRRRHTHEVAQRYCRRCPVLTQCLTTALHNNEQGLWGGLNEDQRAAMRRRAHRSVTA